MSFFVSIDWNERSWLRSTWVLYFAMKADSMNLFTDFWFMNFFKMIVDVTIEFKFFCFILQISFDSDLWNADWLLAFETTDFDVQIFNDDINQLFVEFINIWFFFNQRFSMIILCWSKRVINKDIISFLCSYIMIDVYKACVINFQSEISSYNWINFDFDSNIDWISKHSHSSDIKDSSMKLMSVTSVFIKARNLNIFSRLLKMMSTVNDLKSNELSDMLIKQNTSILLSITTLMKTSCFLNSLRFRASELIQDSRVLYVLTSYIWSKVLFKQLLSSRINIQYSEFLSCRDWSWDRSSDHHQDASDKASDLSRWCLEDWLSIQFRQLNVNLHADVDEFIQIHSSFVDHDC